MHVTGALQEKSTGRGKLAKPTQICYSLESDQSPAGAGTTTQRNATHPGPEPFMRASRLPLHFYSDRDATGGAGPLGILPRLLRLPIDRSGSASAVRCAPATHSAFAIVARDGWMSELLSY